MIENNQTSETSGPNSQNVGNSVHAFFQGQAQVTSRLIEAPGCTHTPRLPHQPQGQNPQVSPEPAAESQQINPEPVTESKRF